MGKLGIHDQTFLCKIEPLLGVQARAGAKKFGGQTALRSPREALSVSDKPLLTLETGFVGLL